MVENLFDFGLSVVAGAVVLLCLFEGTRRLGAHGSHRKAMLLFLFGVGASAAFGGLAYQRHLELKTAVAAAQHRPAAARAAATWSKVASPEKREQLSLAVAQQAFRESGALGSFVNRNGETKTFAPGSEDLAARERIVAYYSRTEVAARNSLAEALLWLIAAIVAVFLGLMMSLDKPPAPKPLDDADASDDPPTVKMPERMPRPGLK